MGGSNHPLLGFSVFAEVLTELGETFLLYPQGTIRAYSAVTPGG